MVDYVFQLLVVVSDGMEEVTRRLYINLTDIDDHFPSFGSCPGVKIDRHQKLNISIYLKALTVTIDSEHHGLTSNFKHRSLMCDSRFKVLNIHTGTVHQDVSHLIITTR